MYRKHPPLSPEEEIARLRLPRRGEVFGIVREMKGGARMVVACVDGKERLCRMPGRIKRQVWVREGDVVLVEPWLVEGDTKGDISYRYTRIQVEHLKRRGILNMEF